MPGTLWGAYGKVCVFIGAFCCLFHGGSTSVWREECMILITTSKDEEPNRFSYSCAIEYRIYVIVYPGTERNSRSMGSRGCRHSSDELASLQIDGKGGLAGDWPSNLTFSYPNCEQTWGNSMACGRGRRLEMRKAVWPNKRDEMQQHGVQKPYQPIGFTR